jgi:hypothetical protein
MGRRVKGSTLGLITGKVGTVIIKQWRGIETVQSLPHWKKGKRICSDDQIEQQVLFKSLSQFLNHSQSAIRLGFQLPKKAEMTPMNAALSYHLLNTVTGTFENWSIDYNKVKFSRPIHRIDNGWNIQFGVDEASVLQVTWELNPFPEKTTLNSDQAVIVYHSQRLARMRLATANTPRSAMVFKLPVVLTLEADEINCWAYFISADKKRVSETKYLGTISIQI